MSLILQFHKHIEEISKEAPHDIVSAYEALVESHNRIHPEIDWEVVFKIINVLGTIEINSL